MATTAHSTISIPSIEKAFVREELLNLTNEIRRATESEDGAESGSDAEEVFQKQKQILLRAGKRST
ncbi:hypothetical protein HK102_009278, partial [Quaeritorhiza haematococci]